MTTPSHRYWAFISYSSKDEAVARRLHRALEHYRIPRALIGRSSPDGTPVPRRLFPIFRDRDELPLSAHLGDAIEDALRASRYLIVLCSPSAATSRWVNEEVRYFKSIGGEGRILAIILAGQPNASDHGAPADEECFPPALRHRIGDDGQLTDERREPVGGDLRKGGDGWTTCLLKAVAGITGMGVGAFTKRESIRRRRRNILTGAAVLLALAVTWTWLDHTRTKVGFYAFRTERIGIPEGVTPLGFRAWFNGIPSYRIETRGGKVRRLERRNGSGFPVADEDSPWREAIRKYSYREDGSLQSVDLLAPDGVVLARLVYTELSGSPENPELYVELKDSPAEAPISVDAFQFLDHDPRSEVSVWHYLYGADGLLRRRTNRDASRRSVIADRSGSAGELMHYDPRGMIVEIVYLDAAGRPHPRKDGVQSIRFERDETGRVMATSYHGADGEPVAGPDRVHRIKATYGRSGHKDFEHYFDTSNQPALHRDGYAGLRLARDRKGNITERAFFATDGRLVLRPDGVVLERQKFDQRGNRTEVTYVGKDALPVSCAGGYDTIRYSYDHAGRMTRRAYFAAGQPVVAADGCAAMDVTYDKMGNFVEVAFFGVEGEPVVSRLDFARMQLSYDEHGNRTAVAHLGVDGKPIMLPEGYSAQRFAYDKVGNVVEVAHFGTDGQLVPGAALLRLTRDARGNVIEESSLDREGRLVLEGGYAVVRRKYDELGNKTEEAYFGTDGRPVLIPQGYATVKFVYDRRGREIEVAFFGTDGRPVKNRDGHALLQRATDMHGREIVRYYDTEGRPVER